MGGKHFGELYKLRNIIYYRLSPFEQRAFAGAIKHGVPNTLRRFRENVFVILPPFVLTYLIIDSVEKKHKSLLRKNPADYENDK